MPKNGTGKFYSGMSKKIFLVDDSPLMNFVNTVLIRRIEPDIRILHFTDAQMAYDRMAFENPDIVFLDLKMDGMTGWDFLNQMKEEGLPYHVVVLSSSISGLDKKRALAYPNVLDYMFKPLEKSSLQLALRKAGA